MLSLGKRAALGSALADIVELDTVLGAKTAAGPGMFRRALGALRGKPAVKPVAVKAPSTSSVHWWEEQPKPAVKPPVAPAAPPRSSDAALDDWIAAAQPSAPQPWTNLPNKVTRPVAPAAPAPKAQQPAQKAQQPAAKAPQPATAKTQPAESPIFPEDVPPPRGRSHVATGLGNVATGLGHLAVAPFSGVTTPTQAAGRAGMLGLGAGTLGLGGVAANNALGLGMSSQEQRQLAYDAALDPNQTWGNALRSPVTELMAHLAGGRLTREGNEYGSPVATDRGMARPITGRHTELTPRGQSSVDSMRATEQRMKQLTDRLQGTSDWWHRNAHDALAKVTPPKPKTPVVSGIAPPLVPSPAVVTPPRNRSAADLAALRAAYDAYYNGSSNP